MHIFRSILPCLACIVIPATAGSNEFTESNGLKNGLESVVATFKTHCVQCHGVDGEVNGDVDLVSIQKEGSWQSDPELLGNLLKVIKDREMPPEDEEPQLTDANREKIVSELDAALRQSLSSKSRLSHAPIRRMNRFQYNNAVIDLFNLKCIVFTLPERMMREHRNYFQPETGKMPETVSVGSRPLGKSQLIEPRLAGVAAFPQDLRAEHGFDNRGDHLSLSPLLMESFLKLGQSVVGSKDFIRRNVGIWDQFFAPPKMTEKAELASEIESRILVFLTRAFRRPVSADTLDRYALYVKGQLESGMSFTDAMKGVAAAAISSPKFLYLYDTATKQDDVQPLDDIELATRLAFFLWGSLPDQELLGLAAEGKLNQGETLSQQVDRMLKHKRVKRFCDSFPSQWLQLERIISSVPNRQLFPDFYFSKYRDSMHMMLEPLLLFETVLIEDLPITQLIDPDFTYRSVLLSDAYGDKSHAAKTKRGGGQVAALQFDRLPVEDRRYGGVITNAAVMTMTSGSERTQPITRGAWLATVVFNDPPEPPPADVPPLSEKPSHDEENMTLRERLSAHRERADCKGCHEQIDPLGFALENFDPVGRWREKYENKRDVDVAGVLFRKHSFTNVVEFKDAILVEKDRFAQGFAEHLLSFALARKLDAADTLAVDKIVKTSATNDYRMKSLIKQVVLSDPFRQKRNPPKVPDEQK